MKNKLLWLDDLRNPLTQKWLEDFAIEFNDKRDDVIWVKSFEEFKNWITSNGLPYMIAFDHDLGEDIAIEKVKNGISKKKARKEKKTALSGFDAAKWLVEYCIDNSIKLPLWVVQSANPVGRQNINSLLTNYKEHCE